MLDALDTDSLIHFKILEGAKVMLAFSDSPLCCADHDAASASSDSVAWHEGEHAQLLHQPDF